MVRYQLDDQSWIDPFMDKSEFLDWYYSMMRKYPDDIFIEGVEKLNEQGEYEPYFDY
jgi:hypothetical protein